MARLPYTLGFIGHGDQVLMLYRRNPPNADRWNGVGGKIEPGELPADSWRREVGEETGITLLPHEVRFAGIVTWDGASETGVSGMYCYIAELPASYQPEWITGRESDEGVLAWISIPFIAIEPEVATNIPCFLPQMLAGAGPIRYHIRYGEGDKVESVAEYDLAHEMLVEGQEQKGAA